MNGVHWQNCTQQPNLGPVKITTELKKLKRKQLLVYAFKSVYNLAHYTIKFSQNQNIINTRNNEISSSTV